jgi:hypothetical protein
VARVVGTAVLVSLLLVSSGGAIGIWLGICVGADGRAVDVGGGDRLMRAGKAAGFPKRGGYLLVYPFLRSGLPVGTGRYYPAARVACFSFFLVSRYLPCYRAAPYLPAHLGRAAALPRFTKAPTRIVHLARNGVTQALNPTAAPTFELAFARWRNAQEAMAPESCALSYVAHWAGPEAATRATAFCLTPEGVYAGGRLYPVPPQAYAMLTKS